MRLSLLTAITLTTSLLAVEPALTTSKIRSFPLEPGSAAIGLSYNRINNTIDIFDIKAKELGSTANFGSIGDSSGIDLSLAYGINEYYGIFYNYQYLNLHYIDSALKNSQNDLSLKVTIYRNPTAFFETLTTDIGFIRNSGDDLDIKDTKQLNKMIQKVNPIPGLSVDGSLIKYKDSTIKYYDPVTNKPISPFVRIGDMQDNSFYIRMLTGFHYETNIVDLYTSLKYTSIDTTVSVEPDAIASDLKSLGYDEVNLDRSEKTWSLGFNYTVEFYTLIFDFNYEYLHIWGRSDDIKKTEDNHIINSALSYIINKDLLVFIGGKLMLNQFNGVIPYLYNKYTKNKYDKKYGYAKIGFVYNFDTSKLLSQLPTSQSY